MNSKERVFLLVYLLFVFGGSYSIIKYLSGFYWGGYGAVAVMIVWMLLSFFLCFAGAILGDMYCNGIGLFEQTASKKKG